MAIRSKLAATISMSAFAAALGTVTTPAFAQEAPTGEDANAVTTEDENSDDVIVVTGLRASIDNSVAKKRENTSLVEVVSAEDLGKLPDLSIAESLSRLPGLATQRLDGRANVVSIRGLAPDFTTTLLNGREQVSANNNRGVELDQYPSELLNGAVVYKTPDAMLIGQALGGTIDMQTVRPLQYGRRAIAAGARFEINDLGKLNPDISNKGYRANISYIDQNDAGTLGWAIGYARMQSPTQEERWNAWGYPVVDPCDTRFTVEGEGGTDCGGVSRVPAPGYEDAVGNLVIGGAKPYVKSNKLTRDGVMGVLEWEPSDRFHTTLDGYWSKFKDEQRLRGIELPLYWGNATLAPGAQSEDGLVTEGSYTGLEVVMRNDVVNRDAEIFAGGLNTEFAATDRLTLELDIGYSELEKTEENLEIYLGTGRGPGVGARDTIDFTMPASGGVIDFGTGLDYSDPNLFVITDPQGWNNCGGTVPNCQDGFVNRPRIKDRLQSIRLQAIQAFDGDLENITVGVNYSDRRKQLIDEGFVLTHKDYPADTPVPSDYLYDPVSLEFIGIPGMVAFDSWRYYNEGNYDLTNEALWTPGRLSNSYIVNEKVLTGFIQANVNTGPLRGNVGLQFIHTDQTGESVNAANLDLDGDGTADGTVAEPVVDGDKYNYVLPSLNVSWEVAPETFIRFGAARMLARARMDQLNPGGGFNFNAANNTPNADIQMSPWSGTIGNARLRPLLAMTLDLAIEKYFGRGGYVSVGVFDKYLENWIYRQDNIFDFTGYPTPGGVEATYDFGIVSQWQNGRGGRVRGAEASASLPFETFSSALDGFGIFASASYTDSEVREGGADPISMPGLSRWVANGTVYFEKNGFEARASARYRSRFLAEVSGLSLVRDKIDARAETVIDAQIGYTFQEGALEGLGVVLQGSNLTNEPFITYYNGDIRQVRDYQSYGRNFSVGVNYRF